MTRRQFKQERKYRKRARASTMRFHRKVTGTKRGTMSYEEICRELMEQR